MEESKQWAYYISSFGMREATEGVPAERMQWPYLRRNLPSKDITEEELNKSYLPACVDEGLVARIHPDTYRIGFLDPETTDRWLHRPQVQTKGLERMKEATNERNKKVWEKFGNNSFWAKGMSKAEVDKINDEYHKSVTEGFPTKMPLDGEWPGNEGKAIIQR